jgi:hypothetical protein
VSHQDQVLAEDTILGCWEPIMWVIYLQ